MALLGTTPKTSVTVAMMLAVTAPVVARCFGDGWCRKWRNWEGIHLEDSTKQKRIQPLLPDFGWRFQWFLVVLKSSRCFRDASMDIMQGTRQVLSVGSTPTRSVFQCFNFYEILLAAASCTCFDMMYICTYMIPYLYIYIHIHIFNEEANWYTKYQ